MRHMENDCKLNYNHSTVLVSISSFISFQHTAASILPHGQMKAASNFVGPTLKMLTNIGLLFYFDKCPFMHFFKG